MKQASSTCVPNSSESSRQVENVRFNVQSKIGVTDAVRFIVTNHRPPLFPGPNDIATNGFFWMSV